MSKKVVVFTSPTCAPCKRLKPELENLSQMRGFELEIIELASDGSNRDEFRAHGVTGVPVTMLLTDGKETDRFVGGMTAPAIEQKIVDWGL